MLKTILLHVFFLLILTCLENGLISERIGAALNIPTKFPIKPMGKIILKKTFLQKISKIAQRRLNNLKVPLLRTIIKF